MRNKRNLILAAALAFIAAVAGSWFLFRSTQIRVWVYTDYAYRFNHQDWAALIQSRFNAVNVVYRHNSTGIIWKVQDATQVDPTRDLRGIDNRRAAMALHYNRPTDIYVVLTGIREGNRTGSVSPFTRVAVVVDFPEKSESWNARLLAHQLACLFGAPREQDALNSLADGRPQEDRFTPRTAALIRRMRSYPFADGIDGLSQGSWEKRAMAALQQDDIAQHVNPVAHAHTTVGIALLSERKTDRALPHFRAAVQADPQNKNARLNLIEVYTRDGLTDKGLAEARELVKMFPNDSLAHRALGAMLGRAHQPDAGIAELQAAARLDPTDADNQVLMGMELAGMPGHLDDAIAALDQAVRLNPDSPSARQGLEKTENLKAAVADALARQREAVRNNPNDPDETYRLAKIEAGSGDFKAAIRDFQKSAELRPTSGTPHMELAQIYMLTGETDTAWAEVRKARALGVEPPQALLVRLSAKK